MSARNQFERDLFPRLPNIIKEYGTPFHIYDEKGILATGFRMLEAFQRTSYRQYYAVKALPNPTILQTMHKVLGFGFDCSSNPELVLARGIGACEKDIFFTSNNTSKEEFELAAKYGGCILNLDDVSLIADVPDPFPDTVCFRINPGMSRTGNSIIGDPVNAKYGITLTQIVSAYRMAMKRGATQFGVHTMVCSNELRASYMIDTVRMLLDICVTLKRKLGIECAFINMGGGFGIPYRPEQKELRLEWMAGRIVRLLEVFELTHGWRPKLFSECGRYVTGPHGLLVSRVINKKQTYRRYLGVDTGMAALMRPGIYPTAYHSVEVLNTHGKPKNGQRVRMSVVGSICENCDRLASDRLLPKDSGRDDIVVTRDTGAHGSAMGFQYNGRLRPQELLYRSDGSIKLIRRAEVMEDLFRTIVFPQGFVQPT